MLANDVKQCDICRKPFPFYESFTELNIGWDHGDCGRYAKYLMCDACYKNVNDAIDIALYETKRAARNNDSQKIQGID